MLRFVGNGDQEKFTENPRHFSMQHAQANSTKKSTKVFWRAGKVMIQNPNRAISRKVVAEQGGAGRSAGKGARKGIPIGKN